MANPSETGRGSGSSGGVWNGFGAGVVLTAGLGAALVGAALVVAGGLETLGKNIKDSSEALGENVSGGLRAGRNINGHWRPHWGGNMDLHVR